MVTWAEYKELLNNLDNNEDEKEAIKDGYYRWVDYKKDLLKKKIN